MTNISNWRELQTRLTMAKEIVVTMHMNPDGDALGSSAAMALLLEALGKRVRVISMSPVPDNYLFLNKLYKIEQYDSGTHDFFLAHCDLGIFLDVGDLSRAGKVGDALQKSSAPLISIDHHPGNGHKRLAMEIIDTSACSTATMIYDFIQAIFPEKLDRSIAEALYVGILTDTGSFRFSNTTDRTFKIVSHLIAYGISPAEIYQSVYEQSSIARMQLLGMVLSNLRFELDKRIVWVPVTQDMVKKVGGDPDDTDGFNDMLRTIQGVDVSLIFKERHDGDTRVNFRAKGKIHINETAKKLGGGGHPQASGAILKLPLEKAIEKTLPLLIADVKAQLESETRR
jgi:bifunctional oligoribonuclease and PAP phosphatase NrnA